jgi:hypothetical protein
MRVRSGEQLLGIKQCVAIASCISCLSRQPDIPAMILKGVVVVIGEHQRTAMVRLSQFGLCNDAFSSHQQLVTNMGRESQLLRHLSSHR